MRDHIKLLGILNIVWSSISIIIALIVLVIFGGLAGVLGVAGVSSGISNGDGGSAGLLVAPFLAIIGVCALALICIVSLPSLIGGIGLIKFKPWSRMLVIVVSVLHLINFPFGTALGVYGLWVLLDERTKREFGIPLRSYPPPFPPSGAGSLLK